MTNPAESEVTESLSFYLRLKSKATGTPQKALSRDAKRRKRTAEENTQNLPFAPGRDPKGLGSVIDSVTEELGWRAPLSQSDVLIEWEKLVGPDIAAKTTPLGVNDATLTISCESTAWATQLRLMSTEVLTKLIQQYPDSGITAIRFQGPDAPSWKRGPKSIPGRGPRDTYG